jgi:hypothetical protein
MPVDLGVTRICEIVVFAPSSRCPNPQNGEVPATEVTVYSELSPFGTSEIGLGFVLFYVLCPGGTKFLIAVGFNRWGVAVGFNRWGVAVGFNRWGVAVGFNRWGLGYLCLGYLCRLAAHITKSSHTRLIYSRLRISASQRVR